MFLRNLKFLFILLHTDVAICMNLNYLKGIAFKGVEYAHFISSDFKGIGGASFSRNGIHDIISNMGLYAFRGTIFKNIRDWTTNLNSKLTPINFGIYDRDIRVHKGFLNEYNQQRYIIMNIILNENKKELLITGYSSGGTLATLLALDVVQTIPDIKVTLITFGMPRLGNNIFTNYLKNQNTNQMIQKHYLIEDDPVGLFPFFNNKYSSIINQGNTSFNFCNITKHIKSHSLTEYSKI